MYMQAVGIQEYDIVHNVKEDKKQIIAMLTL